MAGVHDPCWVYGSAQDLTTAAVEAGFKLAGIRPSTVSGSAGIQPKQIMRLLAGSGGPPVRAHVLPAYNGLQPERVLSPLKKQSQPKASHSLANTPVGMFASQ